MKNESGKRPGARSDKHTSWKSESDDPDGRRKRVNVEFSGGIPD